MKSATIPFPRQFGPGATGRDVRAVKRALGKAGETGMADNVLFGKRAQVELADFKRKHGLVDDPIYTIQAHEKLRPFFDEYGASLMVKSAAYYAEQKLRDGFVFARRWMVTHKSVFNYVEVRPIPEGLRPFETAAEIDTDCSGSIELAARWTPGCPDPSRLGFNGEGNTGSLLHGCKTITTAAAQPGDLIVYRAGPTDGYGHHAVSIDERLANGDFKVVSHGHAGDPGYYLHSVMAVNQRSFGAWQAVFLRFL